MNVHLVGSVGLTDAETVFTTIVRTIGRHCSRIPDGETGVRSRWVRWQSAHLLQNPNLETVTVTEAIPGFIQSDGVERTFFRIRDRTTPVRFVDLGYAREAIASWLSFSHLRAEGEMPVDCRFQVSLPTPASLACAFFLPEDQENVEPAFFDALARELETIQSAIPGDSLAIQWDAVFEVVGTETGKGLFYAPPFEGTVERLALLCDLVADDVELGFHFCYGDAANRHIVEPESLAVVADLLRAINGTARRPLDFAHMPVPLSRNDDSYFAPLKSLQEEPTRIALGLVHDGDGVSGTMGRIGAAQRFCRDFDIATECGFGRRNPSTVLDLLMLHAAICDHG
ncbi:hypothetical protein [Sphingobium sp. B2]|uniref:hypothetical protein n=1 Tax=Sphingobium sp. B2 TaxID=2583228 RepID=UPI0011A5B9BE|nr:hypothetical protein [Sphingobium sp. B2]